MHGPAFFRPTLARSGGLSPGEGWDAVHDAVGVNCKMGEPTNIKEHVPGIWAKEYVFYDCAILVA